jgi:hypothetical protein
MIVRRMLMHVLTSPLWSPKLDRHLNARRHTRRSNLKDREQAYEASRMAIALSSVLGELSGALVSKIMDTE